MESKKTNLTKTKRKQKLNKLKLLLSTFIIVIVSIYIIISIINLIKNPSSTFIVKNGKISKEETDTGYIIREETVLQGQNYKNGMEQISYEGSKVAKGESIFRYYTNGENNLKDKIKSLDIKIQDAIENNNDELTLADTKLLDKQISEKLSNINQLNNTQTIQETKKEIDDYVKKKAKIAGELSPSGSYLKKLIDERSSYENELNSGSEYITSPVSGIVSYRVDGLENILTTDDFSKYNKKFFSELNLKTGQIISTSNETGKIINNFICYIACTTRTEEANSAEIGDKVKIVLPSSKTVDATVEYITRENDAEVTIIFSFTEGINELLLYRKINFDIIWWDSAGYKIANSAIITENNLNYVIRTKAGYLEKVLVKVTKIGEDYSIVTNYSTSEIKDLEVSKKAKTSIMLYDELVIEPSQEQIAEVS